MYVICFEVLTRRQSLEILIASLGQDYYLSIHPSIHPTLFELNCISSQANEMKSELGRQVERELEINLISIRS